MKPVDQKGAGSSCGDINPPCPSSVSDDSEQEHVSTRSGRLSRFFIRFIHLLILLYQAFVLLGFHRSYLREITTPQNPYLACADEQQAALTIITTKSESSGWERTCRDAFHSLRRKCVPVLASSSALYHVVSSIRSPDATQHTVSSIIGIVSVILSANAMIVSTFFLQCPPILPENHDIARKQDVKANSTNTILDKRTQAAMLMSVPSASTFWALTSVVVYDSSGLALAGSSPIVDKASSAESPTPWWFTTLIYTALVACVIHFFGILLWMTRLESHVDNNVYQTLPMPCTTTSRRSTSPFPQCLAGKRAAASLSSAAAGPQLYSASREGSVSTPTTPPTRTDTLLSGVTQREESDDGLRRSRKDTRSPSPHPRTPAASPSPVRPRKRPGRKHCRNSAQQSQERPIEAPQVIRCSSSSSPPFSTIRASSV